MMSSVERFLACFVFVIFTFFAFSELFTVPFYLDDYDSIINNLLLTQFSYQDVFGFYPFRQISYVAFAFIQRNFTDDVFYFHAISLLVHISNALLLILVSRLLFKFSGSAHLVDNRGVLSCGVGVLFLVLPLNSQAVIYIVQLPVLLACFSYLLAMFSYLKIRTAVQIKTQLCFAALLFVAFVLGVMSKQSFFSIPLALLILEWGVVRKVPGSYFSTGLLSAIAIAMSLQLIDYILQLGVVDRLDAFTREASDITRWEYFTHQLSVIPQYLYKAILPYPLLLEYSATLKSWGDWQVWFGLTLLLVLIYKAIFHKSTSYVFKTCALLYLCTHIVESSFLPITDLAFEHRTYLPNAFLCIVLVSFFARFLTQNALGYATAGIVLFSFSFITAERVKLWNDPVKFFQQNLTHVGDNSRAYAAVAMSFALEGQTVKADHFYSMAIQVGDETKRLSATSIIAYMELLQNTGQEGKARILGMKLLSRIELPRAQSLVYSTLAVPHVRNGDCLMAKGLINKALTIYSQNPRAMLLADLCETVKQTPLNE